MTDNIDRIRSVEQWRHSKMISKMMSWVLHQAARPQGHYSRKGIQPDDLALVTGPFPFRYSHDVRGFPASSWLNWGHGNGGTQRSFRKGPPQNGSSHLSCSNWTFVAMFDVEVEWEVCPPDTTPFRLTPCLSFFACRANRPQGAPLACAGSAHHYAKRSFLLCTDDTGPSACVRCGSCPRAG